MKIMYRAEHGFFGQFSEPQPVEVMTSDEDVVVVVVRNEDNPDEYTTEERPLFGPTESYHESLDHALGYLERTFLRDLRKMHDYANSIHDGLNAIKEYREEKHEADHSLAEAG